MTVRKDEVSHGKVCVRLQTPKPAILGNYEETVSERLQEQECAMGKGGRGNSHVRHSLFLIKPLPSPSVLLCLPSGGLLPAFHLLLGPSQWCWLLTWLLRPVPSLTLSSMLRVLELDPPLPQAPTKPTHI